MNLRLLSLLATLLAFGCGLIVCGGTVYNEGVKGDLSNNGLAPTPIAIGLGSNQILGATGRAAAVDRDYLTFTVPVGMMLSSITVLPNTQVGGFFSFIGLEAGNQITLPTNAFDATGLLGWWHYSAADLNTDILGKMGIPANGSTGFAPPLGPGNYSLWIQDFNPGSVNYGFDLNIVATPEAGSFGMVLVPLLGLVGLLRRRAR